MRSIALAAALLLPPGCAFVEGAAVGTGIVHATGEDAVEVRVEVNGAAAYAASREEIGLRGTIDSADPALGGVRARIGTSDVTVAVSGEPGGERSRVSVTARAAGGLAPDMETARILAVAIVRRTR